MANWFMKCNEMARTSHQGKISLAMAFGRKWSGAVWNTKLAEGFTVFKAEDYLTQAYLVCTLPSIKACNRKLTVFTIFEHKRKGVLVMLRGDCGATLERLWSKIGRIEWGHGWRSRWREWGATLWGVDITRSGGQWEMRKKKERKKTVLWLMSVFKGSGQ